MLDLYGWPTPNLFKVTIFLEETGTPYNTIAVDIQAGDQFKPDFLKISPNNKMPAIVDHDGPDGRDIAVLESGAILIYLAEKTGRFLPKDPRGRYDVLQWLMFQMASVGPMFGQANHFRIYAQGDHSYAKDRYVNESRRILNVMDRRLGEAAWLAGDYSIADMACWPWVRAMQRHEDIHAERPNLKRWFGIIDARPAVVRGVAVLADRRRTAPIDDKTRAVLFGAEQYAKR